MGLWSRLAWAFKGASSLELFREVYGGRESRSGVSVTWQSAIEVAAVLACVRVIANGIAQVPWRLYREQGEERKVAADHPVHRLIHRQPNHWQSSFALRETVSYHALLTGDAFVWLGKVGSARELVAMEPIEPRRVTVKRSAAGVLTYDVSADDGATRTFGADDIWHLRGPSWNSWKGLDATRLARDAIGLSISTESAHAEMHKGSARISGLLAVENQIGLDRFEFLSNWLNRHSEGGDRAGKPLVMDMSAKWTPFAMSGVDAQHLETRRHQVEEIARAFGVMPIMIGLADKTATYASAEQMFLAHVVHTLSPWYERIEQSANLALLTEAERAEGYYTKFTPNALMRGAAKDRSEFYAKALGAGGHGTAWLTPNEVRAFEELNPIEGGETLPAGVQPAAAASEPAPGDDPDDSEKD